MNSRVFSPSALMGLFLAALEAVAAQPVITVTAGDRDRIDAIVPFHLSRPVEGPHVLQDTRGNRIPVQINPEGSGWFIVSRLKGGATQSYTLVPGEAAATNQVATSLTEQRLGISVAGVPLLEYQVAPALPSRPGIDPVYLRAGYIHPLLSPSGRLLTDDYPANHLHHHGLWFAWTKTEFSGRHPDFWNMGQRQGTVEAVSVARHGSGPVQGGFEARHRFVELATGTVVLDETWTIEAFAPSPGAPNHRVFDLTSVQRCAGPEPLRLPKYHYGGLGFRGNGLWDGARGTRFLTSEGETDRVKGNETRGRWCHIGGDVDGQPTGATILCHPSNFRAPQPMRLHPTEPFFCFAPSQLGDWEIRPGETYVSRYRFIVADGPPDKTLIERYWRDYADPPAVTVQ